MFQACTYGLEVIFELEICNSECCERNKGNRFHDFEKTLAFGLQNKSMGRYMGGSFSKLDLWISNWNRLTSYKFYYLVISKLLSIY